MRVLVCGGCDFNDKTLVFRTLDRIHRRFGIKCIIHGLAAGADSLADAWADMCAVSTLVFTADWARYGVRAGSIRNQRMLLDSKPDVVVAFPGGRGTKDMVSRARRVVAVVEIAANGHRTMNYAPTKEVYKTAVDVARAVLMPTTAERGAKPHTMKEE